jgi:hypothetical protein
MSIDLCAMARDTGIDITTLASILGSKPVVTNKDVEERFLQITSLEEALHFYQQLPKGAVFHKTRTELPLRIST